MKPILNFKLVQYCIYNKTLARNLMKTIVWLAAHKNYLQKQHSLKSLMAQNNSNIASACMIITYNLIVLYDAIFQSNLLTQELSHWCCYTIVVKFLNLTVKVIDCNFNLEELGFENVWQIGIDCQLDQ